MCTQNRHNINKENRSGHVNRRNQKCNGSDNRKSCSKGAGLESEYSHQYLKSACYNLSSSGKGIEARCLITKQSIKCRHIMCLLFAYFAISASAEATNNGYPSQGTLRTTPQNTSIPDEKNTSIPLPESRNVHEDVEKRLMNSSIPLLQPALDVLATTKGYSMDKKLSPREDHLTHKVPKSTVYDESNDIAEKEKRYFILNLFHRYSNNNFLHKADFEKLLANIGLTPATNSTGSGLKNSESKNIDIHNRHHDSVQHAGAGNLNKNGVLLGKTGHDHHHSCNTTSVLDTDPISADLQQKHSSIEHKENVADVTTVASHVGRQKRKIGSYQHKEHTKCLSTEELLVLFGYEQLNRLSADNFWQLCPALIDQLDAGYCKRDLSTAANQYVKQGAEDSSGSHEHDHHHDEKDDEHHHHHHEHDHTGESKSDTKEDQVVESVTPAVWFYALLSVAVISLCSVAGIVVIPNMKRVFYNHILQFLVALAVGAMSGDAMLHLFPHAMLSDSHDTHHHQHLVVDSNVTENHHNHSHHGEDGKEVSKHMMGLYKGLVALMGIYSFFFLERLFTLFTRNRSGRSERKQKRRRRCRGHEQRNKQFHMVNSKLENDGGNAPSCEQMVMVVHPNKALRAYADVSHEAYLHHCDESLVNSPPSHAVTTALTCGDQLTVREDAITLEGVTNVGVAAWNTDEVPTVTSDAEIFGITKDTEPAQTTHSHSHSHLAPDFVGPLSSVAMMIIVGDMIHNFCDGLAIGAAYAWSIPGGLSTSVAVFCHELPHEIGDFAVLVRSGLTMKRAVYFNLISSIPCFIGAIIGLAVGNVTSTSSWIFAGVGGMFLYITLVDLIPEMSSVYTKSDEPWFLHLLLQASGIAVGTTIMLIISVSEESLLTAFH